LKIEGFKVNETLVKEGAKLDDLALLEIRLGKSTI